MKKRLLSALLALCMVLTLLPATVFAVDLASGNHEKWIDRIDRLPDYAKNFYNNILVEASDNDKDKDYLIDDTYYTTPSSNTDLTKLSAGDIYYDSDNNANAIVAAVVTNGDTAKTAMDYISAAYYAFTRDHNEVFWLSGLSSCGAQTYSTGKIYVLFYLTFTVEYTDGTSVEASLRTSDSTGELTAATIRSEITKMKDNINKILTSKDAPTDNNRYKWVAYFNDWLTKNNEYNTGDLNNGPWDMRSASNALAGKAGTSGPVCEAYAKAFKVLCDKAGIPCTLVDGNAKNSSSDTGEAHMWNYVQMEDNKWYAVDVTWNDPKYTYNGQLQTGVVSGGETDKWLLLGKNTLVDDKSSTFTFIDSHDVSNQVTQNGVKFTNGPVLSDIAYARIEYFGIGWDAAPLPAGEPISLPVTRIPASRDGDMSTYTYAVVVDSDPLYKLSGLPEGLTLNTETGEISGALKEAVAEKTAVKIALYMDGKFATFTYVIFPGAEAEETTPPTETESPDPGETESPDPDVTESPDPGETTPPTTEPEEPEQPTERLEVTDLKWAWPNVSWNVSDPDLVKDYSVEFYYSETENGMAGQVGMGYHTTSATGTITEAVGDLATLKSGYYFFRVQAYSNDTTKILDSYSIASESVPYTSVADQVSGELDSILSKLDKIDDSASEEEKQAAVEAAVEEVQQMNQEDLRKAMEADEGEANGVIKKLEQLEEATGKTADKEVAEDLANTFDKDKVSIVGAVLNLDEGETDIALVVDEATEKDLEIPDTYKDAVTFDLHLEVTKNGEKQEKDSLTVPVQVTLPIPAQFQGKEDQLKILHYTGNANPEVVKAHVSSDKKSVSFVVSSFSDFAMVLEKEIYEVFVYVLNGEGGTVSIKGTDGSRNAYYEKGTEVTVVAEASNGFRFVRWMLMTNDGQKELTTSKEYTFTVGEIFAFEDGLLHSLRADFERISSGTIPADPTTPDKPTTPTEPKPGDVTITNPGAAGGTLTSNAATAKAGDTVKLTSKANAGYITAAPTVWDKDGNIVRVTRNADGTYSFVMPEGGVTITANYKTLAQTFSDLSDTQWYRNDLAFAVENGLISGSNGKYDPNTPLTRGMMVTLLYNLETKLSGKPAAASVTFSDVPAGQYYTEAVAWAAANKIVEGSNGKYNPYGVLDRQQMATMLYQYAVYKGYDVSGAADLSGYTDAGQIAGWALAGMRWANSAGIVTGSNSALNPTGSASRLEGAVLLAKFCREVAGMK